MLTIFADSGLIVNWPPNSTWPFPETFPSICVFVPGSLSLTAKSENFWSELGLVFVVGSTSIRAALEPPGIVCSVFSISAQVRLKSL